MSSARRAVDAAVKIRDMVAEDIDRVEELENEVFPDPWPRSAFEEQISGEGWGAIVAEWGGEVVGYGCYYIVDVEAHLTNIAVVPEQRRKLVANRILDTILERAVEAGCQYVILEVRRSNTAARAFYEKHGFRLLYERPNYYRRPAEDAVVMVYYFDRDTKQ